MDCKHNYEYYNEVYAICTECNHAIEHDELVQKGIEEADYIALIEQEEKERLWQEAQKWSDPDYVAWIEDLVDGWIEQQIDIERGK